MLRTEVEPGRDVPFPEHRGVTLICAVIIFTRPAPFFEGRFGSRESLEPDVDACRKDMTAVGFEISTVNTSGRAGDHSKSGALRCDGQAITISELINVGGPPQVLAVRQFM